LTVQLPAGLSHPDGPGIKADLGDLTPGQVKEVLLETLATQSGRFTNEATIRADDGLLCRSHSAIVVEEPTLELKLQGPNQVEVGRDLELLVKATHSGATPAAGAWAALLLPTGVDFVSAGGGGVYVPGSRTVVWAPGSVPPGPGWSAAVRLRPRCDGDWAVRAQGGAERLAEGSAAHVLQTAGEQSFTNAK
jgi:hypothetical protein